MLESSVTSYAIDLREDYGVDGGARRSFFWLCSCSNTPLYHSISPTADVGQSPAAAAPDTSRNGAAAAEQEESDEPATGRAADDCLELTEEEVQFVSDSCVGLIDSTDAAFGFWGGGGGGAQETGGGGGGGLQFEVDHRTIDASPDSHAEPLPLSMSWTTVKCGNKSSSSELWGGGGGADWVGFAR